jgi:hypothetical protein
VKNVKFKRILITRVRVEVQAIEVRQPRLSIIRDKSLNEERFCNVQFAFCNSV